MGFSTINIDIHHIYPRGTSPTSEDTQFSGTTRKNIEASFVSLDSSHLAMGISASDVLVRARREKGFGIHLICSSKCLFRVVPENSGPSKVLDLLFHLGAVPLAHV